jgi:hypothetical protein
LWGASAERVIVAAARAGKEAVPIRFVHIGSVSARNITLHGAALRSSALELMGSGIGSVPLERLIKSIEDLMRAAVPAGFSISTKIFPLSEVETVWGAAGDSSRAVFQM